MARSVLFRPSFRSVIAREQLDNLDHAPPHAGVLDRSERTGEASPSGLARKFESFASRHCRPRVRGRQSSPLCDARLARRRVAPSAMDSQSAPKHPSEQRRAGSVDGLPRCR
jgi:hypothetical protein